MNELPYIQWFPGHMTKTLRLIEASIGSVDMVIEVADARIPKSSRSPEVYNATIRKPRLIVLGKADLADDEITRRWTDHFSNRGMASVAVCSKDAAAAGQIRAAISGVIKNSAIKTKYKPRAMIVGVPNSGKSTLINRLAGVNLTETADRPGVTRGKQWITLDFIELLDMPGVLSKKFANEVVASKLAFTGAIKDTIFDSETLACALIDILKSGYSDRLAERYNLEDGLEAQSYELLGDIALKRGMLQKGGVPDTERAAVMLLDEYRGGKLGKISLEFPNE